MPPSNMNSRSVSFQLDNNNKANNSAPASSRRHGNNRINTTTSNGQGFGEMEDSSSIPSQYHQQQQHMIGGGYTNKIMSSSGRQIRSNVKASSSSNNSHNSFGAASPPPPPPPPPPQTLPQQQLGGSSTGSAQHQPQQQRQQQQEERPRDVGGGSEMATLSTTNSYDLSINSPTSLNSDPNEAWRKHGKLYRAQLVLTDEEKGGNTFVLSSNCSIERYYKVAERVLDQFLATSINESSELTESYLVGNRLVKFLSVVLPTHQDYFSTDGNLAALRNRSQAQLVELLQYMEELAMLIDEIEYNKFILNDLTPEEKNMVSEITTTANNSTMTGSINDTTLTSIDDANTSDKENSIISSTVSHSAENIKEAYSPRIHDNTFSVGDTTANNQKPSFAQQHQAQYNERLQQPQLSSDTVIANKYPPPGPPTSHQVNSQSLPKTSQPPNFAGNGAQQSNDTERRVKLQQQSSLQWDDDFAAFANERSNLSRIDLLIEDDEPTGFSATSKAQSSAGARKPFPKVKPPPPSRPRSARCARSGSYGNGNDYTDFHASSPTLKSDDFSSTKIQDQAGSQQIQRQSRKLKESPQNLNKSNELNKGTGSPGMRIRIEERLEEAARRQQILIQAQRQRDDEHLMQLTEWKPTSGMFIDPASTEDNSILDGGSFDGESVGQKRILAQFKGCVRCLLE